MRKTPSDMVAGTRHVTNKSGELEVVEYLDAYNVRVRFIDTGFEIATQASSIRSGEVKDKLRPSVFGIGYLGDGEFKTWANYGRTKEYVAWQNMLQRCYDPKCHVKRPTYIGCSVCAEWHNFQNFAKWMSKQNCEGKQLDKDIKVEGNKVYSPETCMFVTPAENVVEANAKQYAFVSPSGVVTDVYNLSEFCRENGLDQGNMSNVHAGKLKQHKGWVSA